ncbi:MAG: hypothetical protein V3S82_07630 [Dehalococcoidia bacterium]
MDARIVRATSTVEHATDDHQPMAWRGTRDGVPFTADWVQALALEGRCFVCGIGTLSDGEALPNAAITTKLPSLWVRIPKGITGFPIYAAMQLEAAGDLVEVLLATTQNDIGNGTSSAADYGPINLRTDAIIDSKAICRQEATVDTIAETNILPLKRMYHDDVAVITTGDSLFEWSLLWSPSPVFPVLVGPATFVLYVGADGTNAPTVTAQMIWAEVPSNSIT